MEQLAVIETDLLSCEKALINCADLLNKYKDEDTKTKLQNDFNEMKSDLDDQLRKIRKRDFEIAVVGREKAGKSSLVNAWIGFDLLPSDRGRCTYTTTEIRSCADISEQKYLVEYFTKKEFEGSLTKTSRYQNEDQIDLNLEKEESKEVEKYREQIMQYLDKPADLIPFESFEQIKDQLKSCITNPAHARAVKKICIWTPKLSNKENVVLHDVPGYDSPITLHKEQTRAKIASVDAILYAKQFVNPDLVDCELEILRISDSNNPYIKAKDKIIVALTNCDQANSTREFDTLVIKNKNAWKINEIPEARIIPVCSLAESQKQTNESEVVRIKLNSLNGGETGFKELKEAVNRCIIDSRFVIAKDRSNEIKNKILDFSKKITDSIKTDYGIDVNSQVKDSLNEDEMNKIHSEWWAKKWKLIREEFQMFFNTEIIPKVDPDAPSCLNEEDMLFKKKYEHIIEETIRQIPATKKERQIAIYHDCIGAGGIVAPKNGNTKIRAELSDDATNSLDKITGELNAILWSNIDRMIRWIRKNLWNLPEIRQEMIGTNEKFEMDMVKRQFDALIQRLARPATNIFLTYPRSRVDRIRVMNEYQMELLIINKFILNGKLYDRGIIQFLANGKFGNFAMDFSQSEVCLNLKQADSDDTIDDNVSIDSLKIDTDAKKDTSKLKEKRNLKEKLFGEKKAKPDTIPTSQTFSDDKSSFDLKNKPKKDSISDQDLRKTEKSKIKPLKVSDTQFGRLEFGPEAEFLEEIQDEIRCDIDEFIMCMKNSIFHGSGIQRFYHQELERLRRKFIELENDKHRWFYLVFKYIKQNDSKVNIPAPKMEDELAGRVQIINSIKEIKSIVDNFQF